MNKKLVIKLSTFTLVLASITCFSFKAIQSKASSNLSVTTEVENNIEVKSTSIIINNNTFSLYPTYADNTQALEDVKKSCSSYLNILATHYNLPELSTDNWNEYKSCMTTYLDEENKVSTYNEFSDEYVTLATFFDTFENQYKNSAIKEELVSITNPEDILTNDTLIENLPNDVISYLNTNTSITKLKTKNNLTRAPFNINAASQYARAHATNHNKSVYKSCKADCTNFTSQVVLAGGKTMTNDWKAYNQSPFTKCYTKYTFAWCNANGFVNYFKAGNTYSSFKDVTANAREGQVIAYDLTRDNDWDHVGYIVDTKSYSESLGYSDIEVAQHSRDYLLWASDSNNGWDTLQESYPKVIYTLVSF